MDVLFSHRNPAPAPPRGEGLQGLKLALQATLSVAGWPTDAGSSALADFTALEDATLVQRLRQAEAYFCGSTRTSEFGFGLWGGEAGGALAQDRAEAELVLDIMGESRLAAAQASAFGFKPSHGLISRAGLVGLVPSMEGCGILARNVETIRRILATVAGPDERDFSLPVETPPDFSERRVDPRQTTLGIVAEATGTLSSEGETAFRAGVDVLRQAGFAIREMTLPDFPLVTLVHKIVGSVEASSCAGRYDSVRYGRRVPGARNWNDMYLLARGAAFGTLVKSYLLQGAFFQFERYEAYEAACRIRARLLAEMQRLVSHVDVLLLPTDGHVPADATPSLADTYAQFATTLFANVTGQPALYLPLAAGGAQAGIQLVGARFDDARLLAFGESLSHAGMC